jgi:hypothetical protein
MIRSILLSSLLVVLSGLTALACKPGGVGDPCIPNLEYSPGEPGATELGAQVEDRSFQCETRVCLINHFRGRVTCPLGNPAGGSTYAGADKECFVPGTTEKVTASVRPQCKERKDAVYCSCRCDGEDKAAKYCECPSGFECKKVTNPLDKTLKGAGDMYCIRSGDWDYQKDGTECSISCDIDQKHCDYTENKQKQ